MHPECVIFSLGQRLSGKLQQHPVFGQRCDRFGNDHSSVVINTEHAFVERPVMTLAQRQTISNIISTKTRTRNNMRGIKLYLP